MNFSLKECQELKFVKTIFFNKRDISQEKKFLISKI